jgi:hypothetical protein
MSKEKLFELSLTMNVFSALVVAVLAIRKHFTIKQKQEELDEILTDIENSCDEYNEILHEVESYY